MSVFDLLSLDEFRCDLTPSAFSDPSSWAEEEEEVSRHRPVRGPVGFSSGWAEAEAGRCRGSGLGDAAATAVAAAAAEDVGAVWSEVGEARCVRPAAAGGDDDAVDWRD